LVATDGRNGSSSGRLNGGAVTGPVQRAKSGEQVPRLSKILNGEISPISTVMPLEERRNELNQHIIEIEHDSDPINTCHESPSR
jgi:hypothetical protein